MVILLAGILMTFAGLLSKCFPPKAINSVYGYRTKRSMADEKQWKEGNRFSTNLIIIFGLFSAGAGIAGSEIISLKESWSVVLQLIYLTAVFILIFILTEKRLKTYGGEQIE